MKKVKSLFLLILFVLILCNFTPLSVFANSANSVYLGGFPAGFSLETRGAFVMGLSDVVTFEGIKSPSKEAGVAAGDIILSIDGVAVNNAEDVEKVVKDEKEKLLEIKRCDEKILLDVSPALDMSGNFRLGIFIRDGVNGIGTVTFVNNGRFASLGHPVTDEGGKPLEIIGGKLYNCNITGYIAGERGKAGELRGTFLKTNDIGNIEKNLISGVYGTLKDGFNTDNLKRVEIGEGKIGSAVIYTTIEGDSPKEYDISIVKVTDASAEAKNYVIKINDKALLDTTGGIVQGMSGSPILQDGKIVGAVTHVFINDPSRGFGISIDNMINN